MRPSSSTRATASSSSGQSSWTASRPDSEATVSVVWATRNAVVMNPPASCSS